MQRLKDMVAIITGGAGGMGHVAAKTFTEEGACVVLADRDADKLQAVVEEVSAGGAKVIGWRLTLRARRTAKRSLKKP